MVTSGGSGNAPAQRKESKGMKLHKTNNVLMIQDGGKTIERCVYIDERGVLYAKYHGDIFRLDHFAGRCTLYEVDHHGRKCIVRNMLQDGCAEEV